MTQSIQVCIIDDQLPKTELGSDDFDYYELIDSVKLMRFLDPSVSWGDEANLREILRILLSSPYYVDHRIRLAWATHPGICLNAVIHSQYKPDVVVYDWEIVADKHPEVELEELLKTTSAFFFVYSNLAAQLPITLYKEKLDDYSNRLQVLRKGDMSYVYSSEELIYQYLVSRIEKNPRILIGGSEIQFHASGFIKIPSDILYLESVIGREFILERLNGIGNDISDETVEQLLSEYDAMIYLSKDGHWAILNKTGKAQVEYGPLQEVSYADFFRSHGLRKLHEVLDRGIVKV